MGGPALIQVSISYADGSRETRSASSVTVYREYLSIWFVGRGRVILLASPTGWTLDGKEVSFITTC